MASPQRARAAAPAALCVEWLGRVPYREALALQERALAERRAGRTGDRLLLLEHPPVITLGRRADGSNLRASPAALAERGVEVVPVARGGDVTWHGPGQLVGYPIVDLAARGAPDVHRFLREMEAALVAALASFGIRAGSLKGMTGVYVEAAQPPRKLASIGIGLRHWITWHGFALNVSNDPAGFADIVPCGLHQVKMTSIAQELARERDASLFEAAREAVTESFAEWLA